MNYDNNSFPRTTLFNPYRRAYFYPLLHTCNFLGPLCLSLSRFFPRFSLADGAPTRHQRWRIGQLEIRCDSTRLSFSSTFIIHWFCRIIFNGNSYDFSNESKSSNLWLVCPRLWINFSIHSWQQQTWCLYSSSFYLFFFFFPCQVKRREKNLSPMEIYLSHCFQQFRNNKINLFIYFFRAFFVNTTSKGGREIFTPWKFISHCFLRFRNGKLILFEKKNRI